MNAEELNDEICLMEYELDKFSDRTAAVDTIRECLEETLELLQTRLA